MNDSTLICRDEGRRQAVREQANNDGGLNGIDYVEVIEGTGGLQLCVHFFGNVPTDLTRENVRIHGGARIRDIKVVHVEAHPSDDLEHEDCLRVIVDKAGDFSCYTLCLYELDKDGKSTKEKLKGFDSRYVCAEFSFKIDCPSEMDCRDEDTCPVPERPEPEINYLARDYGSFRQLLLDRLSLIMPEWRERHVPDIGITLVEMLAYAGDHLSYYQDAVATEAYLDTARKRISVRRHAQLVDYRMHEGCNARTWLTVKTNQDITIDKAEDVYFITGCEQLADLENKTLSKEQLEKMRILSGDYEVFEPLAEYKCKPLDLFIAHNEIYFYTWGNSECCLPRGATRATLIGRLPDNKSSKKGEESNVPAHGPGYPKDSYGSHHQNPPPQDHDDQGNDYCDDDNQPSEPPNSEVPTLHLKPGDVLIFEEILGAKTAAGPDADPRRRCAVRLTAVEEVEDKLAGTTAIEVEWAKADALKFELCISSFIGAPNPDAPRCEVQENISVARGNVILVDHGETVCPEDCGEVQIKETIANCSCKDSEIEYSYSAERFSAVLKQAPLTYAQKFSYNKPASLCLARRDPREALPSVALWGRPANDEDLDTGEEQVELCSCNSGKWNWFPKFDLLKSTAGARDFVVEIDDEQYANLRFGDGDCGLMPAAGTAFTARYRTGNGRAGNVAAETLTYMVTRNLISGLQAEPRNPLAAEGGLDPEPIAEVKLFAPGAFRKRLERAITADDYAELAMRNEKVQKAAARLRWSGSWPEACVDIDPFETEKLSGGLRRKLHGSLYPYRRIGHDLRVNHARYVPLSIGLKICVAPHFERGHIKAALLDVFSDRILPNGRRGVFHPDNLTFGDGVTLSALIAAALTVDGVVNAEVITLERLFEGPNKEIENGILPLGTGEIAQLDNNPNFPERGKLKFTFEGGRR
jgi:hypothetical protein